MAYIPMSPKYKGRQVVFSIIDDISKPTIHLPPLYMQINPATFNTSFKKKTYRYQTFSAFVEEYWGEELDSISTTNSTGGFILEDFGLTNIYKTQTRSFFRFQDMLDIYRNNGNTFDEKGRVVKKGYILLSYDMGSYFGYFETFNYREVAETPFRFLFEFAFKVQRSYLEF